MISKPAPDAKPSFALIASLCVAGAAAAYLNVLIPGGGFWPGWAAFLQDWPGSDWFLTFLDYALPVLGALVVGLQMDRRGRRSALVVAASVMGIAALIIGTFPEEIPYVPRAISDVLPRLAIRAEYFLAGAVVAGAIVYVAEIAPAARKAFYVSFQAIGWVLAGATAWYVHSHDLTLGAYAGVTVLASCIVLPLIPILWRRMPEIAAPFPRPDQLRMPVALSAIWADWRTVITGIMLALPFPTIIQEASSDLSSVINASSMDWSGGQLVVLLAAMPLVAWLGDKVGSRKLLIIVNALAVVIIVGQVFDSYWLPSSTTASYVEQFLVLYFTSFLHGSYCGLLLICLTEMMPAELRATCVALALSLAFLLEPFIMYYFLTPLARFPVDWLPWYVLPRFANYSGTWAYCALIAISLAAALNLPRWRGAFAQRSGSAKIGSAASEAPQPLGVSNGDPDWRDKLLMSLNDEHVQHLRRGDTILIQTIVIFGIIALAVTSIWIQLTSIGGGDADQSLRALDFAVVAPALAYLIYLFRRAAARRAGDELLRLGSRRPFFYLRSFDLDKVIARASFLDLVIGPTLVNKESAIARQLRRYGPVLAVGRPGEILPPIGAARFYVNDNHWKEKVADVVQAAQLVIWTTGRTEGLRWEISHLLATTPMEKLVVMAHPHLLRLSPPDREIEWKRFLDAFGNIFPHPFPDYLGIIRSFHFDREQRPMVEVSLKVLLRAKGYFIPAPRFGLYGFRRITRQSATSMGTTLLGGAYSLTLALLVATALLIFPAQYPDWFIGHYDPFVSDYVMPMPSIICALFFVLSLVNLGVVAVNTRKRR